MCGGREDQELGWIREGAGRRWKGTKLRRGQVEEGFWARPGRGGRWKAEFGGQALRSSAVDSESDGAELVLKGPAAGEMEADATGGLADAGSDFEELGAQGFDLGGAPGLGQLQ